MEWSVEYHGGGQAVWGARVHSPRARGLGFVNLNGAQQAAAAVILVVDPHEPLGLQVGAAMGKQLAFSAVEIAGRREPISHPIQ